MSSSGLVGARSARETHSVHEPGDESSDGLPVREAQIGSGAYRLAGGPKDLAAAVILQAKADLTVAHDTTRTDATEAHLAEIRRDAVMFFEDGEELEFWGGMAGLNTEGIEAMINRGLQDQVVRLKRKLEAAKGKNVRLRKRCRYLELKHEVRCREAAKEAEG